ncbi:type II secretion system ATPase GspE [Hirschia maritima]|uniref:type II secretion system ATPase GspE n=1 Tax=Hirschia maritima TaxID=1121961 RepID=UPI000361F0E0|nr:type II secretion system ATPase GspE [Hirschia maritima]
MDSFAERRLNYSFAKEKGLVFFLDGDTACVGVRKDADPLAILEARRIAGQPLTLVELDRAKFDRRLSEIYASDGIDSSDLDDALDERGDLDSIAAGLTENADLLDTSDDAPIIRLINGLIAEAVRTKASDVHIEPFEDRLSVRLRVDGVMREVLTPSRRVAPLLVSRIKVMARLDIAEKRVPQDGRVSLSLGGRPIDVRVSTLPSRYGERVVMRLLDKESARLDLDDLGMPEQMLNTLKKVLKQPNGIVLVTGPTGSGKTTTLYAALTLLNEQSRNILTVEDPIEYGLDGVGQTQVNSKVGMTFAAGLRAILRQDPDIVMIGEIRDGETAQIAVQASLTGHLVLSTVHTNSAAAAVTRLRDMGVEPFLLSSTLTAVVAQRLVRRLCSHCKSPYQPDSSELKLLGLNASDVDVLYKPEGCEHCNEQGYEGRLGIYEVIEMDTALRGMVHDNAREQDIEAHAFANAVTLQQCGAEHVRNGLTSSEEVLRVVKQARDSDGSI